MSHPSSKAELAEWMGYGSAVEMDAEHDKLHETLCLLFGVPSFSLKLAQGEKLSKAEWHIANFEEDAVINVQRWLQHLRKEQA